MILYNILLVALGICSVGFIVLNIAERVVFHDQIVIDAMSKGILGILSIISICVSKQFILADTGFIDLGFVNLQLATQNFFIILIALFVSLIYFIFITRDFSRSEIPYMVLVIFFPVIFMYIFK